MKSGSADGGWLSRTEELHNLRARAKALNVSDDSEFIALLTAARTTFEMSDQEIADEILVSRPTVSRWLHGKNLPLRAMRKPIATWIETQAARRLRAAEPRARSGTGGARARTLAKAK